MKLKKKTEEYAFVRREYEKAWRGDREMIDYSAGKISHLAPALDGFIIVERPEIKTAFCFGYDNAGEEEAAVRATCIAAGSSDEYFMQENTAELRKSVEALAGACANPRGPVPCLIRDECFGQSEPLRLYNLVWVRRHDLEHDGCFRNCVPLEDGSELRGVVSALYEEALADHEKRLRTYLKRYGLSKCSFWTYWRD